jgi:hypothetical protein
MFTVYIDRLQPEICTDGDDDELYVFVRICVHVEIQYKDFILH